MSDLSPSPRRVPRHDWVLGTVLIPYLYPQDLMYNVTSVPQPGINNRTSSILAAATAGGGSAVNGAMLERGSPMDYVRRASFHNVAPS